MYRFFPIALAWCLALCLMTSTLAYTQPVTLQRKSQTDISSEARSVFTRFKDRFFSNYKYFDELKNSEINLDAYTGYSISLGKPNTLHGMDYGINVLLDYYFKEGLALRTGLGIRGNNLYRNVQLDILTSSGAALDNNAEQRIRAHLAQLLIPVQFVFTHFRYNVGFWTAFGVDIGITLAGRFKLKNVTSLESISSDYVLNDLDDKFFDHDPNDSRRRSHFNRFVLYGDITVGYKFSRFLNAYAKIQPALRTLQNKQYQADVRNHAINFGVLLSLWQY